MADKRIITADGSHTLEHMGATYHSRHGALQESRHIYIHAGLQYVRQPEMLPETRELAVFEMGFGTGLNALLSFLEAADCNMRLVYHAVEWHPLLPETAEQLNYPELTGHPLAAGCFSRLHTAPWEKEISVFPGCMLHKTRQSFPDMPPLRTYHLIYYDAFAPGVQPELWQSPIYEKLYRMLLPGGMLVTYCCKGAVRRGMEAAGFITRKLAGPPGKREFLQAIRPQAPAGIPE